LYEKNIYGDWSLLFNNLKIRDYESIIIPQVNKKAWQYAFMIKLNRKPELLKKFNKLTIFLNNFGKKHEAISYDEFKMVTLSIFGNNWINDVEDIAYFYKTMNFIELDKYKNGSINALIFIENFKMPKLNNFNSIIVEYMEGLDTLRNIF